MNRNGGWMHTHTGRQFWPLDPRPEEIHVEDIAAALAKICRFGGHVRQFYSVAEHSIRVMELCHDWGESIETQVWALLHDATEAYLGDVIRPLKCQPEFLAYRSAEHYLQCMVCSRFGLPHVMPDAIQRADAILLATEARDLKGVRDLKHWDGLDGIQPLEETLGCVWGPEEAEAEFLDCYDGLMKAAGRMSGPCERGERR